MFPKISGVLRHPEKYQLVLPYSFSNLLCAALRGLDEKDEDCEGNMEASYFFFGLYEETIC